jgi:hypothetical protein
MVDITGKLLGIKEMVDAGKYFVINKGRQYGKTTTLAMLEHTLAAEYLCISLSFEGLGEAFFASEEGFCRGFVGELCQRLRFTHADSSLLTFWNEKPINTMQDLSWRISDFCLTRSVVLMIDEVDKASNFRVFLDFLGLLRSKYLARNGGRDYTFQSVILAGVYDIKNIKLKMVGSGNYALHEGECRMVFLIYIKSLLNGVGFYHIESQTTDDKRMDIVVNYQKEEFIIELKTWHGEQKHQEAYGQLLGYMNSRRQNNGYLMTFDFSVQGAQVPAPCWISFPDGKCIYDTTVRPHVMGQSE